MISLRLFRHFINRVQSSPNADCCIHRLGRRLCTTNSPTTASVDADFAGLRLSNDAVQRFLRSIRTEHDDLTRTEQRNRAGHQRLAQIHPIIALLDARADQQTQMDQLLHEMRSEKDAELLALIDEEKKRFAEALAHLETELMRTIFNMNTDEAGTSVIFEVSTGVGGQEAMLFASELFDMYCGYFVYHNWTADILLVDRTELGGIRHASAIVNGPAVLERLQFEAGVHRVQRIPQTERAGRVHTSTVSVAVIPRPDDLDLNIKAKDLRIETKRASGAGGQHVNTTDSAVRMVHLPTGVAVECQSERSQIKNRELALKKLQAKLVEQFMSRQQATVTTTRKGQVGSSNRNEKIRTYNFNQDRITDHRLSADGSGSGTVHNLAEFLQGGDGLDALIEQLRIVRRRQAIVEMIESAK